MSDILQVYGTVEVHPNLPEILGSDGANEALVEAILRTAWDQFSELRSARYDEYGGQSFDLDVGVDPSGVIDMTILPDDLEEVIREVQSKCNVTLSEGDKELLEIYLNGYKDPFSPSDRSIQRALPIGKEFDALLSRADVVFQAVLTKFGSTALQSTLPRITESTLGEIAVEEIWQAKLKEHISQAYHDYVAYVQDEDYSPGDEHVLYPELMPQIMYIFLLDCEDDLTDDQIAAVQKGLEDLIQDEDARSFREAVVREMDDADKESEEIALIKEGIK